MNFTIYELKTKALHLCFAYLKSRFLVTLLIQDVQNKQTEESRGHRQVLSSSGLSEHHYFI